MSEMPLEQLETHLQQAAKAFAYPPTPDIAGKVARRLEARRLEARRLEPRRLDRSRLAWVAAILIIALAGLLAVPPVRAQILEFLQIGVVRIFPVAPTPTPTPSPMPSQSAPLLLPSPTPLASVLDLAGETTLEEAEQQVGFPVRLPAYPPDLGSPDRVFLQNQGGDVLVLVWLEPGQPDQVRLSLHIYGGSTFAAEKWEPHIIDNTRVGDRPALWTTGPYPLINRSRDISFRRLIQGHVLVWEEGGYTYRLETDLEMEEAVRIAESLEPLP